MASTQYITLEEFTSSASPLPTILLPRPQALRLVELCELAEMTPSANFIDFVSSDDGELPAANGGPSEDSLQHGEGKPHGNPHLLVTQMALLIYLGEYGHARHLWRRHRLGGASPSSEQVGDGGGAANNVTIARYDAQLKSLWNAAKFVYLWSTGGIHSLTSCDIQAEGEGSASTEDGSDLPFSTLALCALQSCRSSRSEPLSTYAEELEGTFRSRINRRLRRSLGKLDCNEFCLRMNLDPDKEEWNAFGWKREEEGGYLIPDFDMVLDDDDEGEGILGANEGEDRIGKLTNLVMFLEGKVNA